MNIGSALCFTLLSISAFLFFSSSSIQYSGVMSVVGGTVRTGVGAFLEK